MSRPIIKLHLGMRSSGCSSISRTTILGCLLISSGILLIMMTQLTCGMNSEMNGNIINLELGPLQFVNYNTSYPYGYFNLQYGADGKLVMGVIPVALYYQLQVDKYHQTFKVLASNSTSSSISKFRLYTGLASYFVLFNPSSSETIRIQYFVVEKVWNEIRSGSQSTALVMTINDAEELVCRTCLKNGKSMVRLRTAATGSFSISVSLSLSFDGVSFVKTQSNIRPSPPYTYFPINVPDLYISSASYVPFYIIIQCVDSTCPLSYNVEEYSTTDIAEIVIIIAVIVGVLIALICIAGMAALVCCCWVKLCKKVEKEPPHLEEHHHELLNSNPAPSKSTTTGNSLAHNPVIFSDHHETDTHSFIDTYHTLKTNTTTTTSSSINSSNQQSVTSTSSATDDANSNLLKNRYDVLEKIGSGSFGDCFLCKDTKNSNRLVAIKSIRVSDNEMEKAIDECSKTLTFKHPRLVEVYELFVSKRLGNSLCLVMKYYKGDLDKCLKINGIFSEKLMISIINQIGDGLSYLHNTRGVLHRDLKPKNIFVDNFDPYIDSIEVVIGDYGEAKEITNENNSVKGTIAFMSPECLSNENYGMPSDIFSLGVSFYQLMTNDSLQSIIATHLLSNSEDQVLNQLYSQIKLQSIPYSEPLIQFVLSMLKKNPSQRPTCSELRDFQLFPSQ